MDSPFKNIKVPQENNASQSWLPHVDPNDTNFGQIVSSFLPYFFGAVGIILLLIIISSGYQMMTSAGDPKKMQAAQGKLTTALIGILILFSSFFIIQLILKFLGINLSIFT